MNAIPAGCEPACHGCRHRELTLDASAAQKTAYLERTLARWRARMVPLALAEPRWGYRERVSLNARWSEESGWRFGLVRREGRAEVFVPIPRCPVHAPRINALLARLAAALPPAPVFPLAFVVVSGAQATLIVKAREAATDWLSALAPELEDPALGLAGLWLHLHPSAGRRLFARSGWVLLWGARRARDARGLCHGPTAFAQPIADLHARALDRAESFIEPGPGTRVLDLCCGIGASTARWAAAGSEALGVELSGEAVECAGVNAPGAQILRGTNRQRLPQIEAWTAAGAPPRVFVNPPRSGLEPETTAWLAGSRAPRIAYLSCSAGTLARDLALLEAAGFEVTELAPFDFFPQTQHVEVLALLQRRVG